MIEINDDETASRIYTEIDNATGDEREQMADALITYGEKKAKEEYNATDEHFSNLFLDDKYYNEQVNTPDLQKAYEATPFPKEGAKRAVLQGYLQHASGAPVSADTYEFIRDSYAQAKFGKTSVSDDEMFGLVRGDYEWQKQRTEAINDLQMQAVAKAINDSQLGQNRPFVDGITEVFNQWQGKYPELVDGKNDSAFLSQGYKLYYDTINDLDTVRPQASKALSTLTAFTQGNASDEEMQSLANDFVAAPPEDRQKIYKYVTLAAQAGQIDRSGLEQFAINMGQSFTRGFDFVPQGTLQMQEAGVNNWLESIRNGTQIWVPADGDLTKAVVGNAPAGAESDAWRQATLPETETLIQSGQNVRESFKVVRELRNVAKTGVDPIRPVLEEDTFWGTAERGAYGLAGSIPLMGATAVNPYLGVLAYQATEYDRIMLENPDMNPQFAQGLALVEGAANAAIDRVQLNSLSGKLPMFGRYLDRIKSDGIRRTIKIGANVVEQNLQEGAQDLIAPVLETAVAALREDMPDKDFSSLMDEWGSQRAETFFATLPLALIGGGIATYQDIKNPSAELNATKLRQVGFDKEQTTFIQRADSPEEYTARIQMEWDKRTPENIEAGRQEILAEMQKAATPGENDARISETVAEDGTRRWVVTAPDGRELLQTQDQQAALEAIRQHGEAQLLNQQFQTAYEPQELRQIINDRIAHWTSQDSNNTLNMKSEGINAQQKLEQLQAAGNAAQIEELHNRIAKSPYKDTPYDQINILGEASVQDVAEMVWKPLITINPNTRPENLREEIHHIGVKVALKNGRVTLDTLRGWLEATEAALPDKFQNLVRETEGDIIESFAQVQAAYEDGKINADEETKLPASFVDYIKNMMRAFAEVMRRAVALKGAFKDGILPAEYETFLAESVGLNQQTLTDTVRDRAKTDLITNGGQMLMDFSIGSRASAVSNDTPAIRAGNATIVSPTNFSIGAFHGTPHKVDRFRTEKIGTGEGAQVYGWGLYFAENPEVAETYRRDLAGEFSVDGQVIMRNNQKVGSTGDITLDDLLMSHGGNIDAAIQWAKDGLDEYIPKLEALRGKVETRNTGNTYTVDLDVEPEDLLDWDKPLSEQSEKVKAALKSLADKLETDDSFWNRDLQALEVAKTGKGKPLSGSDVYADIQAALESRDSKAASEALLSAGIKGIQYLDGQSRLNPKTIKEAQARVRIAKRNAENSPQNAVYQKILKDEEKRLADLEQEYQQNTFNYVIFDENLIKITGENGQPVNMQQAQAGNVSTDTNYSIGTDMQKVPLGADLAQVWNKFPKSEVSLPDFPENATREELKELAVKFLKLQPRKVLSAFGKEVVLHDVKNIKGKAEHFVSGQYRERPPEPNRVRTLQMLAHTIQNAMAYGSAGKNRFAYIYRYSDGTVHVVIAQNAAGKEAIQRQFTITQFDHDTSKQISGIRILRKNEAGPQPTATPKPSPSSAIGASEEPATFKPISDGSNNVNKNYSISSQSEIDRVNKALGGMNRGPDARIAVYERAREKFSLLQAWNRDELQAMQETGADAPTIRRSQVLQGLGELDAILSVIPPEVRGRVGGYTKLASIAPHDVFKDGVKVSEVSSMDGALISAWMREGLNIGEAGKKVDFPPGYTATENLTTARADRAIADFFRDRIKKIDAEFEKVVAREYRNAILDLVKKSRPKAGDNNVRKSTLGAKTQKLADMVQRATLMDEDAVAERMLQLEQTMATSENSTDIVEEWGILNQFGDLKNRNSETLAQAYGWFKDQLQMGREAWRIKEEARIAENRERAKKTVEHIGGATAVDRFTDKTFMDRVSDWANHALLDHASFEQFVTALFPPDVAADFSERLRKADVASQKAEIDQREGILNALREGAKAAGTTTGKAMVMLKTEVPDAVRYLDGRKVKNTKLTIEQAEKIVRGEIDRGDLTDTDVRNLSDELAALPADTRKENITLKQIVYPGKEVRLPMTRGKAIQLLLSWNQPDVQDKMRREGWNEDSIADLRELTADPVSQAMIAHAQEFYRKGAGVVNPVYARMFGMNMPQVKNYAPTRFKHSKDVPDIGLDGAPVATGATPSFAKSRVSHSAKIAPEDALSVMQQHILTQTHWVNFAELAREYRSLINNPEIREAIEAKHGTGVLKTAELWADQMEQRGGNQSREAAWVNAILGSVIGGQSVASLGFNLKTLAMQLDNSVRFALALDTKQIMAAMSSPDQLIEDIKTVFESDALQTRLRGGATAETRYMFERFGGKPGTAAKVTEAAMSTINWMDTATTSFSAAIVYRSNLNEALKAGMPESLARETALDAAAAAIYRFAQPVSFGQKSNVENSGNIYTKAFFLFMSDPRLKTAIMADAVRGLATGRGDKGTHIRRLVAVELMAVLSHVVASAYRDAFTDDEDEDIWGLGGFVRAIALAPLQGFFFAGTMFDSVLSQLTGAGFFTPTQNPLLTISQTGIRALKNADDILAFDDPDALLKEWSAIARTMAVAPAAAMPAVLLNAVKPIFGAASNASTED